MKEIRRRLSLAMAALLVLSLLPVSPWTISARAGISAAATGSDTDELEDGNIPAAATAADAGGMLPAGKKVLSAAFAESVVTDGVKITVSAPAGVFPDGAVLKVKKADLPEADAAVQNGQDAGTGVRQKYTFDIKVLDPSGDEVEPDTAYGQASVTFTMAGDPAEYESISVYHVQGEKDSLTAEKLDTEVTGDGDRGHVSASVKTDGFSLYILEFAVTGYAYALPLGQSVALSAIMDTLGITGTVTDVESSGTQDYISWLYQQGQWYITARKLPAGTSAQTMTLTIEGQTSRPIILLYGKSVVASLADATLDGDFMSGAMNWSGTVKAKAGYVRPNTLTVTSRDGSPYSANVPEHPEGARYFTYDNKTGAVVIYGIGENEIATVSGTADHAPQDSSDSGSGSSASGKQWVLGNTGWSLYVNGTPVRNAWAFANGKWYHFSSSGIMQTGWINDSGKWYYLDAAAGTMTTGLFSAPDGHTYYFNEDGSMAVGDVVIDGVTHHFNDAVPSEPTYNWNAETETWEPNGNNNLPYGAEITG